MIKGSRDFMERSSLYITIRPSLVSIDIVVVKI